MHSWFERPHLLAIPPIGLAAGPLAHTHTTRTPIRVACSNRFDPTRPRPSPHHQQQAAQAPPDQAPAPARPSTALSSSSTTTTTAAGLRHGSRSALRVGFALISLCPWPGFWDAIACIHCNPQSPTDISWSSRPRHLLPTSYANCAVLHPSAPLASTCPLATQTLHLHSYIDYQTRPPAGRAAASRHRHSSTPPPPVVQRRGQFPGEQTERRDAHLPTLRPLLFGPRVVSAPSRQHAFNSPSHNQQPATGTAAPPGRRRRHALQALSSADRAARFTTLFRSRCLPSRERSPIH